MRLAVLIPTHHRKAVVGKLLSHLERQERLPDEVVLSVPDASHVEAFSTFRMPVTCVTGRTGSCAQRNQALDYALPRFDIVTFFDDDFVPADDYLAQVERLFARHADWSVATGWVVQDGARSAPLSFEAALAALSVLPNHGRPTLVKELSGAYGCNMSMRTQHIGDLRFDERLALHGWQEDVDFTSQMRRAGRVVFVSDLRGVHLGAAGGRVSGRRVGYSQIVNPAYLIRKGTVSPKYGLKLLCRNLAANLVRSVRPEPHIDRRGRLQGNLLGLGHLAMGRVEPERILTL
jgi:GT2 family glycosyltransferase